MSHSFGELSTIDTPTNHAASAQTASGQRIRFALDRLAHRHPSISALRALIPASLDVTSEFVDAFNRHADRGPLKSQLFRALILDATVIGSDMTIGAPEIARLISWWTFQGYLDSRRGSRARVPASVANAAGALRSASVANFSSAFLLANWWSLQGGNTGKAGWLATFPANELGQALEPLIQARTLSAVDADALISGPDSGIQQRAEWHFHTGIPGLDLRNTLVFLAAVLLDRDGGRIQSKLPAALTQRWRLRRISVPDVLAFADVATLACAGALNLDHAADRWGLVSVTQSPRDLAIVRGDNDATGGTAFVTNLRRWIFGEPAVWRREALRAEGLREGTFDTGFLFNVQRLPRAQVDLEEFAGAYGQTNARALVEICSPIWPGSVGAHVHSLLDAGAVEGIQARGVGNILAMLHVLEISLDDDMAIGSVLPPVARYALGSDDPLDKERKRSISKSQTKSAHSSSNVGRRFDLPLLDLLRASLVTVGISELIESNASTLAAQVLEWRLTKHMGSDLTALIARLATGGNPSELIERVTNALLSHFTKLNQSPVNPPTPSS